MAPFGSEMMHARVDAGGTLRSQHVWFLAVVLVNLLIATWLAFAGDGFPLASSLLLLAFVLAGGFFAWLIAGRGRPVALILFVFFCYGFAMPGVFQLRTGDFYWVSDATSNDIAVRAALMVLISLSAFLAGYFTRISPRFVSHSERLQAPGLTPSMKRALVVIVMISVTYTAFLFHRYGADFFFSNRNEFFLTLQAAGIDTTSFGLTRQLCQALGIAALAISGYALFLSRNRSRTVTAAAIVAFAGNLLANFPASVSRFWLVATGFVVLLTWGRSIWERYHRQLMVALPFALYLLFPTLGHFNRHGENLHFDFQYFSPSEYMSHGDLDGFQSIMNAVHMVDERGISFGHHLLSAILFFVPRSLWAGKAEGVGSEAAATAGYVFQNISMPLPGEMFVNFGWPGVVAGLYATGSIVRRMDGLLVARRGDPAFACASILTAAFIPILFRGSLLAVIAGFAAALFVVAAWKFLYSARLGVARPRRARNNSNPGYGKGLTP